MRDGPRSVDRIIDLLNALALDRSGKTLSQLSTALEVPKASLFSMLGSLTKRDVLLRDENGRFHLGPEATRMALNILASRSLMDVTHPVLVKLAAKTGETALIACLEPNRLQAVYIDKAESQSPVRYTVPLGQVRELHCSSVGKLMLAYMPDIAERVFKKTNLVRYTDRTIVDRKQLAAQIKHIRQAGLSRAFDESSFGASGIAAPVLDAAGTLIAGLVVAGPTQRMRRNMAQVEAEIVATAQMLSRIMPVNTSGQLALALEEVQRRRA